MAIQDVFLTYANESLEDDPKIFYRIRDEVIDNFSIYLAGIGDVIKYIIELSSVTDPDIFLNEIDKRKSMDFDNDYFNGVALERAIYAISGDRETNYSTLRSWKEKDSENYQDFFKFTINKECCGDFIRKQYVKTPCRESLIKKCYTCHQSSFRDLLLDIVQGKEYPDIEDFERIALWAAEMSAAKTTATIKQIDKNPIRYGLKSEKSSILNFKESMIAAPGCDYHGFNEYLFGLAAFSLMEFLIHNDRRKLKICPYCDKFFVARDLKRKLSCYAKSCMGKAGKEKKRRQRELNPLKYM